LAFLGLGSLRASAPPQKTIASPGKGLLAIDESNATCGKRLDSIGMENTEANRLAYRELLVTTPGLGQFISGAILFEETLYQTCSTGKSIVDTLNGQVKREKRGRGRRKREGRGGGLLSYALLFFDIQ
jgi:fructose-bisphosphate aldolase class 1